MGINIGDMRSEALGLNKVLVTDRESAARAITIIDTAIDKVSMQRAKLGAYQNRLEHTINNLTVASENLTAAERGACKKGSGTCEGFGTDAG
jgi:flagellin